MVTLSNGIIEVKILPRGVTFASFKLLEDNINIISAYNDLKGYEENDVYLGSTIGPLAGRTAKGMYGLDLDLNDGNHHLHGGKEGISNQVFDVESKGDCAVFKLIHQEIKYEVKVSLKEHDLKIDFYAKPSTNRPINMTNHMYFNLLGEKNLDNHTLQVEADRVSLHSDKMLNEGNYVNVEKTVFDLREESKLSEVLSKDHNQFEITRHIDHTFLGNKLIIKAKQKSLKIEGSMPGIHVYLSNYFDESFVDEYGRKARNHSAIAVEPQYVPNDIAMPIYSKDKLYKESIVYTLK